MAQANLEEIIDLFAPVMPYGDFGCKVTMTSGTVKITYQENGVTKRRTLIPDGLGRYYTFLQGEKYYLNID